MANTAKPGDGKLHKEFKAAQNALHEAKVAKDAKAIAAAEAAINEIKKKLPPPKGSGRRWK